MMQTTQWGKMKTSLESYVGFDTIQEQIRKKSLKRGFELNIMVVGRLGMDMLGAKQEDKITSTNLL